MNNSIMSIRHERPPFPDQHSHPAPKGRTLRSELCTLVTLNGQRKNIVSLTHVLPRGSISNARDERKWFL
jgi:hypothetical protein